MIVYTDNGRTLTLKEPAIKSGGEGSVYQIEGYPNRVVKIYKKPSDAKQREAKITEMVKMSRSPQFSRSGICNDVAWPMAPIYDKNQRFIGFGMKTIHSSIELDDLYVYPPGKNKNVTTLNRIDVLISLCDCIEKVHNTGQVVIGDENPNNMKIDSNWKVKLLDADSYHVRSGGVTHKCVVCAPGYVAPELVKKCRGTSYADAPGETFTEYTDRFSLAVHIFRMLMNGAHPYTSRPIKKCGSVAAPKPIDRKVEKGECVYFTSVKNMAPPPFVPNINSFPGYLCELFRRAFADGNTTPSLRPSPSEWKAALQRYRREAVRCSNNASHYHMKGICCPYCEADHNYEVSRKGIAVLPTQPTVYTAPATKAAASGTGFSVTSTHTDSVNHSSAASAPPSAKTAQKKRSFTTYPDEFWFITVIAAIAAMTLSGIFILPQLYDHIFHNEIVTVIGTIAGILAGLGGTILYNVFLSAGRKKGYYHWYDYPASLSSCLLSAFAVVPLIGIILGLFEMIFYLAGVVMIYCIAAAIQKK